MSVAGVMWGGKGDKYMWTCAVTKEEPSVLDPIAGAL